MESYIVQLGYPLICLTMICVGIFGVFPSSKLLYLTCGYLASIDQLDLAIVIPLGAIGHLLGNYTQYIFANYKGLIPFSHRHVSKDYVLRVQEAFIQRPVIWLFIGKLIDPIKWFICLMAGSTRMPFRQFFPVVLTTSIIWASTFCYLGFTFGKSAEHYGWLGAVSYLLAILVAILFFKSMAGKMIERQLGPMATENEPPHDH